MTNKRIDERQVERVGFRNNLKNTGVYDTKGVTEFHGLKWKFRTDGPIVSSPTVSGGVAYIGSDDTYLYAINLENGEEKWKFKTRGPIKSTAAVYDDTVFISSSDGHLYAIDVDNGELKWNYKAECEDKKADPWDLWQASPITYKDQVFFGGWDGHIYALNIESGDLVKKFSVGRTHSTPAIVDGKLYVAIKGNSKAPYSILEGSLSAYDLQSGEQVWTFDEDLSVVSSVVYDDGLLYIGNRTKDCLMAVDAKTGELEWKYTSPKGSWNQSTPALKDGILYVGSSDELTVSAFDAKTGESQWQAEVVNSVHSSPAYADGIIYFAIGNNYGKTDQGLIQALDAKSGKELWNYPIDGHSNSSPVIDEGVLYVGSDDGYLYAIY